MPRCHAIQDAIPMQLGASAIGVAVTRVAGFYDMLPLYTCTLRESTVKLLSLTTLLHFVTCCLQQSLHILLPDHGLCNMGVDLQARIVADVNVPVAGKS